MSASSVVFLDLRKLLALGRQAGLGAALGYGAIKVDLAVVRSVSVITSVGRASQKAEVFLEIR